MQLDFCSYNIRGLHNKVSYTKDFLSNNNFSLVALLETHVKKEDADFYTKSIAPRFKWFFNYDSHYNGRIWIGWDDLEWSVQLLFSSAQDITCRVQRANGSFCCIISVVYAYNSAVDRRPLWNDLISMHNDATFDNMPWCIIGDFNTFMHPFESSNGMPRRNIANVEFKDCISTLGLTDLKFSGPNFTWWDGNIQCPLMRKLDRALVNGSWLSQFDLSFANILPRGISDHNPVAITFGMPVEKQRKPFMIFKHLIDHEDFLSVVSEAWSSPVFGNPWHILITKQKAVKVALKRLNSTTGNLHNLVADARNALHNFQLSLPPFPSANQRILEGNLCDSLSQALAKEESLLRQKSRINWLKNGDGNNKFFFNSCRGRWNSNKIIALEDEFGNIQTSHHGISEVAVNYFQNLIGSHHPVVDFPDHLELNHISE